MQNLEFYHVKLGLLVPSFGQNLEFYRVKFGAMWATGVKVSQNLEVYQVKLGQSAKKV